MSLNINQRRIEILLQAKADKQIARFLAGPPQQPKQARRFRPLVWLAGACTFVVAFIFGGRSEAKEYNEEHNLP